MSPDPTDNPFEPPTATSLAAQSPPPWTRKAHVALTVTLWVLWVPLFISYFLDALIGVLQKVPPTAPNDRLVTSFAVTSCLQLILAGFLRWLFFRRLIGPDRVAPGSSQAVVLGIFGALVIFAVIRCVETYGFILFLQYHSWPLYLCFSIPSLICFLLMMPPLLLRWKQGE